ncbi:MAG: TGS domain-containing protein, partial [Candidatus Micrarchaeota archaeon]|nr:TGS domain-containing protein [Candidatus Micrarchaeota archaeon]
MTSNVILTLPDGKPLEVEKGATVLQAAAKIGPKLALAVVAGKLDGNMVDLSHRVESPAKLVLLKPDSGEGLEVFRHSSAHVLCQAVQRLFPDAKPTIGPVVEEGFYYDFARPQPFTPEDLAKIEEEMRKIVAEDQPFERREMGKEAALALYPSNPYKRELINGIEGDKVSVYFNAGKFYDLCAGPHVPNTGRIKAFKLTKVAGAYWRADAKNDQLQRIYGISFPDEKQLSEYATRLEEAEKRDHRK